MPSQEELARLYATPHQHAQWVDHRIRVDVSAVLAAHVLQGPGVIVDLSCGDAAIAKRLGNYYPGCRLILGDYAPGYEQQGPIEETLAAVGLEQADLWILSETLEHLDDPDAVLRDIRLRTRRLLLSTPEDEADDSNLEHLWSWSAEDIEAMLEKAGFKPLLYNGLDLRPAGFVYRFGIWLCE